MLKQQANTAVGKPFEKGQSGNPAGRPKGARNRLSEAFLAAVLDDWQEHGSDAIQRCREEQPAVYFKTIASLLPKEREVRATVQPVLSNFERARRIAAILQVATDRRNNQARFGSVVTCDD